MTGAVSLKRNVYVFTQGGIPNYLFGFFPGRFWIFLPAAAGIFLLRFAAVLIRNSFGPFAHILGFIDRPDPFIQLLLNSGLLDGMEQCRPFAAGRFLFTHLVNLGKEGLKVNW
jgi:hypothetical protein